MEEETDASETDDAGDIDASHRRRKASLSGSDSDGSVDRRISMMHRGHRNSATTPLASTSSRATTPRAFTPSRTSQTPRELVTRLGYPRPLSGDDDTSQEPGAAAEIRKPAGGGGGGDDGGRGGNSIDESRSGRVRSIGSGSDGSESTRRKALGRGVSLGSPAVGTGVKLSAEAAAILNAEFPTPNEDDDSVGGTSQSRSTPGVGDKTLAAAAAAPSIPPNPRKIITRTATTPAAPVSTVSPFSRQTITRNATAPDAPLATADRPGLQGRPKRLMPRSTSLSADRPLTLDRPVTPRWMEVWWYIA